MRINQLSLLVALMTSMLASPVVSADLDATPATASPQQRADGERLTRVFDEVLHSSNLRLRVMAGSIHDPTDENDTGRTSTPIDALAESARGSTDPMVLAMLIGPCSNAHLVPKPTCDAVDLAKRWTLADTQNQLAWLTLSSVLRTRGDSAGARAAVERASTASMWHEYYDEGLRVAAAAIPQELGARTRLMALQAAGAIVSVQLVPSDAMSSLWFHCKDPALREACARIADTIARDSGSLFSTHIALRVAQRVGTDAATVASRERADDALQGASVEHIPPDPTDIADPKEMTAEIARIERRIELGELPSMRAMLARSGMTEAAAADRYRRYRAALVEQAKAAPAAD